MSSGFLGLAYIAEVSVVFNLAYSELRDGRYIECAESTISTLRNKIGKSERIAIEHLELYTHLDGLTNPISTKRRSAWACRDDERKWLGIWNWFLSDLAYPFFINRKDKLYAVRSCALSVAIIVILTLFDHYPVMLDQLQISEHINAGIWCLFLTGLLICMLYPVFTVFIGRSMMKRVSKVSNYLIEEFKKIVEPAVKDSITQELSALNKLMGEHK